MSLDLEAPGKKICVPHWAWLEFIAQPDERSSCGEWLGHWKAYSPPENSIFGGRKQVVETFAAANVPDATPRGSPGARRLIEYVILRIEWAREEASQFLTPVDQYGIFRSLILDQRGETSANLSLLRILGFVHLASASGIHLYSAWSWCEGIAFFLVTLGLISAQTALRIGPWLAWPLCIALGCLGGARSSMLRPLEVLLLRRIAKRLGFRWNFWVPLTTVIVFHCIADAHHRNIRGTLMASLPIVGGMLASHALKRTHGSGVRRLMTEHFGVSVGSWIMPALLEGPSSGLISIATPFLSFIGLPAITLGVFPLLLLCLLMKFLSLGSIGLELLQVVCKSLDWGVYLLAHAALQTRSLWQLTGLSILVGAGLASLHILFENRIFSRAHAYVLFATLAVLLRPDWFSYFQVRNLEAAEVVQLDVGQGDSTLVLSRPNPSSFTGELTGGLIDAGSQRALSEVAWLEAFASRNLQSLDWIAITHLDEDHVGGVLKLAEIVPIHCVASAREQWDTERGVKIATTLRHRGVHVVDWESGCVPYPVHGPEKTPNARLTHANEYMSSIYVPILGGKSFLSMGDADVEDEVTAARWVNTLPESKNRRLILKVSHHGSKTSTSSAALSLLKPTWTWISSGMGNRYGHPSPVTLDTLRRFGLPISRTDEQGRLSSNGPIIEEDVRHPLQKRHP